MAPDPTPEPSEASAALHSLKCRCGTYKEKGASFCGPCYHTLPHALRTGLRNHQGAAYEAAYERACRVLDTVFGGPPAVA
jgi:hypothetical protein